MVRPVNFRPQTGQPTHLFSSANMAFWHIGQNTSLFSLSAYIAKCSISSCNIFSYSWIIHCSVQHLFSIKFVLYRKQIIDNHYELQVSSSKT